MGWSIHAEGRALDLAVGHGGRELGDEILEQLLERAWELGLQRIIWFDQIYDVSSPLGEPFQDGGAHQTHLHIELTREAAESLTWAIVYALIGEEGLTLALTEDQVAAVVRKVLAEGKGYGQQSWPTTVQSTLAIVQGLHNAVAALDALVRELLAVAGTSDTEPAGPAGT